MKRQRRFGIPALALAGWVGACGGQAGQEFATSSDVIAACAGTAHTSCSISDSCQGGWATLTYGSLEACDERGAEACEKRAASAGKGYGVREIKTCEANQLAQTCEEWVGTLTPGCGFVGLRGNGAPCLYGSQCASGFCDEYRYYTTRNVCGVCATPPPEGGACNSSCGGDGMVSCVHDDGAATGHCVRLGARDDACDKTAPCGTGLGCAIPSGETSGRCLPTMGDVGDACDDQVGPFCDYRRRIYCNHSTSTCTAAQNAALGQPCGTLASGEIAQCVESACHAEQAEAVAGTCIAYLPDGAACTFGPGTIRQCAPPALCASGVCRIVGGELCD